MPLGSTTKVILWALLALGGCGARSALPDDAAAGDECRYPAVAERCVDGWCKVLPGCFQMGDLPGEVSCSQPEVQLVPARQVTLTRPFELGQHEVTQKDYRAAMGVNPVAQAQVVFSWLGIHVCDSCPVYYLTWSEAAAYCNALSRAGALPECYSCSSDPSGVDCKTAAAHAKDIYGCRGYRLPTEAEWEYAYNAGTRTPLYSGTLTDCGRDATADAIGWYLFSEYPQMEPLPQPVGQKKPNGWGFFDLSGNVAELVHDGAPFGGTDPQGPDGLFWIAKGGSVLQSAAFLRGAARISTLGARNKAPGTFGVRCARTLR